jgi:NAD-dependent DNA ligase
MPSKPLGGLHFVITGEFGENRASIVKKLIALGAVSHSGITSKTNLLIVGSEPGEVKLRKADVMGIRTADRDWLVRALALGGYILLDAQIKVENA